MSKNVHGEFISFKVEAKPYERTRCVMSCDNNATCCYECEDNIFLFG